jgi:calcium-dependent protein kinase
LTKSEKENLDKIFKALDKNGDGKLSKEEIYEGYDTFFGKSMDKEGVDKMFDSVDLDQSGFIDYSEFVIAAMNEKSLLGTEKL